MIETASWLRRLLALFVDWIACWAVVAAALGPSALFAPVGSPDYNQAALIYVHGLWVLESTLFISLMGGSFGHLATRLRVTRTDGRRLDPLRALLRSVLVALVIPPLVFRPDGRGLHDMVADSVIHPLRVAA